VCYFFEVGSFQDTGYRWSDRSKDLALHSSVPQNNTRIKLFFLIFYFIVWSYISRYKYFKREKISSFASVLNLFWNTSTRYILSDFKATRDILLISLDRHSHETTKYHQVDPSCTSFKVNARRDIQRMLGCSSDAADGDTSKPWHVKSLFLLKNRKCGNEHVSRFGGALSDADTFIRSRCYTCKLFVTRTRGFP